MMPACSFQRSAFTPDTMSENIRESSARPEATAMAERARGQTTHGLRTRVLVVLCQSANAGPRSLPQPAPLAAPARTTAQGREVPGVAHARRSAPGISGGEVARVPERASRGHDKESSAHALGRSAPEGSAEHDEQGSLRGLTSRTEPSLRRGQLDWPSPAVALRQEGQRPAHRRATVAMDDRRQCAGRWEKRLVAL
jgi:hypothetical protein